MGKDNNKTYKIVIWIFLIGLFFFLRLNNLGSHPQHVDESYAILASDNTFSDIINILKTKDPHPPVYYSIMKMWISLGKSFEIIPNEQIYESIKPPQDNSVMFFLRLPGLIISFLTFLLLYKFGRKIYEPGIVFFALFIFSISRLEAYWAQSVRYHTLLMFSALASTYLFYSIYLDFSEERENKNNKVLYKFILYSTISIIGFYTNYFMGLIIFTHFIYLLIRKSINYKWIISWAAIACGFMFWIPVFLKQLQIVNADSYGTTKVGFSSIPLTLYRLIFSYGFEAETPVEGTGYITALLILGIILYFSIKSNKLIIWLYTFTPMLILFVLSLRKPLFSTAYFLISFPGYCLFLGAGIESFRKRLKNQKN